MLTSDTITIYPFFGGPPQVVETGGRVLGRMFDACDRWTAAHGLPAIQALRLASSSSAGGGHRSVTPVGPDGRPWSPDEIAADDSGLWAGLADAMDLRGPDGFADFRWDSDDIAHALCERFPFEEDQYDSERCSGTTEPCDDYRGCCCIAYGSRTLERP